MNDPWIFAAVVFAVLFAGAAAFAVVLAQRLAAAEARASLGETGDEAVRAQAALSAQTVTEELIKRADATFQPVAQTLAKFEEKVAAIEKARAEETGALKQQIAELLRASAATQDEARKLSSALRRGAGVQGRWGEQMLRNVLEAAGLQNRFDFEEQSSTDSEEGRRRPDVTVRLPGGGVLVIDAKCSLNAFLEAQDATDDQSREAALVRHAQSVRDHVRGLSAKAYWDQFKPPARRSPDMVAMFLPGDGYLAAALERLPDLLSEAMHQKVVVVTPTTLFALCKAVAYGWRMEENAKGAEEIAAHGRELYKRLSVMGGHVQGMGRALEGAVQKYNAFIGSLETQVLTQARRFEAFSADHEGRKLPELDPVEALPRPLAKLSAEPEADEPATLTLRGR
jgi:DNA recombination protein RmuC